FTTRSERWPMRTFAFVAVALCASAAFAQGPVLLVGIDTEYGQRPSDVSHGSIDLWADIIQKAVLANVKNGRTGILVIGGGGNGDDVTSFWSQIGTAVGQPVIFINRWFIDFVPFELFAMIAVANATDGTGILTKADLRRLNGRRDD